MCDEAYADFVTATVYCENVTKVFQRGPVRVDALTRITMEIRPGEFVALRGPSGSGKSTLLNIIGCLDTATSGKVVVLGQDVTRLRPLEAGRVRRAVFGFVLQELSLLNHLTASENVCLPLVFDSEPPAVLSGVVDAALDAAAILHKARQYPWELSAGERQRVAIARSLVHRPKILLADEPTANLDSANADNIAGVFRELRGEGTAIVVATHDDRLSRHADRVVWLVDGKIEPRIGESSG